MHTGHYKLEVRGYANMELLSLELPISWRVRAASYARRKRIYQLAASGAVFTARGARSTSRHLHTQRQSPSGHRHLRHFTAKRVVTQTPSPASRPMRVGAQCNACLSLSSDASNIGSRCSVQVIDTSSCASRAPLPVARERG